MGRLSDKFGCKPVFMASLAASSVAFIIFGLADSLPAMFVARFFQGVTGGNISVAFAMVSDSTSHENRAKYLGYTSGSMALAFIIGPMLGGPLMGSDLESFTHTTPSIVAAGMSAIATMIGVIFLNETRIVRRPQLNANDSPGVAGDAYVPPRVPIGRIGLALIILQFFIGGYVSGSDQFVYAFWAQGLHGWGPSDVSFGMAAMGGSYMLATIGLVGPLTKHYGDLGAYMIGGGVDAVGLVILILGPTIWISFAGLMIAFIGVGIWSTVLSSVLTKISPEDKIGYMLGVSNGASMIGRVLGPLIAGGFFIGISYTLPYVVTLSLVLIVVANAIRLVFVQQRATASK